jgi:exopolysaccharide biosynthesis predicted pyruvyltransferase EpsI
MTEENIRMQLTSLAVINRLHAAIHSVLKNYRQDAPYALLDFPNHSNVGDSAIWAGEMAYMRHYWGRDPSYVCEHGNVDWTALTRAVPSGLILLHGGGNFGDIWPAHQQFREEVLKRYPSCTVVQLPQSLQFNDQSSIRRAAQVIAGHKKFILLARDQATYDFATKWFECVVRLCPDMAFCLGRLARSTSPSHSLAVLLRTDKEAASVNEAGALEMPADAIVEDWLSEPAGTHRYARITSLLRMLASLDSRNMSPMARRINYYDHLVKIRIHRGVSLISRGSQIISDRLHAHILGTLLDVPQVMLDNNYGKIGRFIDTWQSDWTGVRRAADLSVALLVAADVASSHEERNIH